jgi:PEP-CTERM motif
LIKKLVRITLAVGLLSLASTVFASTAQVVNGGFETGDFSGWTQFGDTSFNGVCSSGNCPDNYPPYAGNYAAYFGPVGDTGGIYQDIDTVPGQLYTISFYLALPIGGTPNFFSVQFGNGSISFNDFPGTFGWGLFQFTDIATSTTTRLTFTFREDPDYWFLDNVNVTNGGGTTPEPGTLVLFGSGILGIAGVVRRKFRA